MTRFARAKGSKSSNEKKPEEATSWAEMKKSMLSKKSTKPEEFKPKEETQSSPPKQSEWASLGDNYDNSLLNQTLDKRNKESDSLNNNSTSNHKTKRKKEKNEGNIKNEMKELNLKNKKRKLMSEEKDNSKKMNKKMKKNNKREFADVEKDLDVAEPSKKKKKMKMKSGDETQARENQNQNLRNEDKYFKKEATGNYQSKNNNKKLYNEKFSQPSKHRNKYTNINFETGNSGVEELIINGEKIPITKFQGFYVTLEDAERLKKLRNEMIKEGIPKPKLEAAIKLERRRAEKALSRLKKSLCFHCRGHGHFLSNCPKLTENENTSTGICYKCGSTEHSASDCKVVKGSSFQFAECFICKEQGHIARQCPDNPRGLYPQGGACRECGDVTHLRKDCPKVVAQKVEETVTVGVRSDRNLECLDEEITSREKQNMKKERNKISTVKF